MTNQFSLMFKYMKIHYHTTVAHCDEGSKALQVIEQHIVTSAF